MSTANLLATNTLNFQDLIGNGKSYKVPPYQRDYSWTEEQWEDLWLDIMELQPDARKRHYMGAVVVKAESDREFLIIDGQQRIATLTILGLAVINKLHRLAGLDNANEQRATALRSRFIGEKDPASLTEISKLVLNAHDNGFFQDYLVQLRAPTNKRSLPKSNRLLWDCFSYFERKIQENAELTNNGQRLAELLSEVVARRLMFILITVEDEISAYTVFETLNARGLELTTTDLLKNYLFSRLHATSDLEAIQRRWQRLVTTVRQERFGEFLRFHYLTKYRQIRTGRLFKMVRDDVHSAGEVLSLVTGLEDRAELFDALGDPYHSLWIGIPGAQQYIRELNLFRVRQMTPLLFAAFERLDAADFVRVLKFVAVISFRYTVISGLNPSELEPAYHDAARALLDGTASTPQQVFESLSSIYVSDAKFQSDFSQQSIPTSGQRKKLAKYILGKLESDLSGRDSDFETDPGTIEHILPENPSDEWERMIPHDKWEDYIYRLGNLTLLKASTNRDLGIGPYEAKVGAYQQSEYAITRQIVEFAPDEWNVARIEARQRVMAERALHIWRSDFA
jgi:hypothetical protein